jgi:hypothetical protein
VDGVVDLPIHGEVDVAEEEGLTPGVRGFRVEVFSWPEQPVEGDDGEEDDMVVERPKFWVAGVKDGCEGSEDGEVCGVGAAGGVVALFEAADKISE